MSYGSQYTVLRAESDSAPSSVAHPLTAELTAFGRLRSGWSYGQGRPISEAVISKAQKILEFGGTQLHLRAEVFPGRDGDVAVAFHNDDCCVQVTVNPDLSLGLRVERGHGAEYDDVIDPIDRLEFESYAYSCITRLVEDEAWKLPASSTYSTLVGYADASSILPLRTPAP